MPRNTKSIAISNWTCARFFGLALGISESKLDDDPKKNHRDANLLANDLECDDLGCICLADTIVLSNYIEEIVVAAVSYHLMNNKEPEYRNGKLVISSKRSVGI